MPAMRHALVVLPAMLLCAATLFSLQSEIAAADPCVHSSYRANCVLVAKKSPRGAQTGSGGGGSQLVSRSGGGAKSGPSPDQLAREFTMTFHRALARQAANEQAYSRCIQRARATCSRPQLPAVLSRTDGIATSPGQPRPAGAPPVPQITPAQAGAIAVARLSLPANAPNIGPDPKKNKWHMAAVGYPLWLWADGPTHIGPVGDNVAGLAVSLDATVSKTMFRMGDGKSITCRGAGTPYTASVQPGAKSPACGYAYDKPSLPGKNYTVTAITYWDVTWTVNGISGVQTVPMAATRQLPVGEVQVLVR